MRLWVSRLTFRITLSVTERFHARFCTLIFKEPLICSTNQPAVIFEHGMDSPSGPPLIHAPLYSVDHRNYEPLPCIWQKVAPSFELSPTSHVPRFNVPQLTGTYAWYSVFLSLQEAPR